MDESRRDESAPSGRAELHLVGATEQPGDEGVRRALEAMPLPAIGVAFDATIDFVNAAARSSAVLGSLQVIGTALTDVLDDAAARRVSVALSVMARGEVDDVQVLAGIDAPRGRVWPVALTFALVRNRSGRPSSAMVLVLDAEADDERADLRHRAFYDRLTELPNRSAFVERLTQALARARRRASCTAVLFIDLDGFKAVNDTFGHSAGDELLFSSAGRISAVMRPEDTFARYGGDEFTVLCEDLHAPTEASAIAVRVLGVFDAPFQLSAGQTSLSASIGVAVVAAGGADAASIIETADAAMYASKQAGGAKYETRSVPAAASG